MCISLLQHQNLQMHRGHDVERLRLPDPRVCGGDAVHVLLEPPEGPGELEDGVRGRRAAARRSGAPRYGSLRRRRAGERAPRCSILRSRHDLLRARRLPRRVHLARRPRTEGLRLLPPPVVYLIYFTF